MAENILNQVQRLVEQLSPHEQAHLLAFLALRIAQVVTATHPLSPTPRQRLRGHGRSSSVLAMSSPPVIRQHQRL
jgi:hypothetical protein